MKKIFNISRFFHRINREIRMICLKKNIFLGAIFLVIGALIWILCADYGGVAYFWTFPQSAMPVFLMYLIWAISFFFVGMLISACLHGIEKFRRHLIYKDILLLIIMQVFSYICYPLFFGACAPFLSFLALLVASISCFIAMVSMAKFFSLWTILLSMHFLWLLYNAYVSISFSIIN